MGGNAAGARERALDDAIEQAVDQTIAGMLDAPTRAAQAKALKAIEAKARSFVPRYRTLEEGEANGVYTIRLEAEVDEIALRRKIERGASPSTPPPVTPAKMGVPGTLVAQADKSEASAAFVSGLVTALSSAGVRARAGDPGETSAGAATQAATRASLEQAALVTSEVVPEGTGARNRPGRGVVPRERPSRRGAGGQRRSPSARPPPGSSSRRKRLPTGRRSAGRSWARIWRAGWRACCRRRRAPARPAICGP